MLDLGFRFQLTNIFELIPENRQNIMFSATMTDDIDTFIYDYFIDPVKISIAVSGTPLDNIALSNCSCLQFTLDLPNNSEFGDHFFLLDETFTDSSSPSIMKDPLTQC